MKFNQLPNLPFIINKRHIYNKLSDKLINSLDLGWTSMDLELHSQLFCGESKVDGVTEFDIKKIKLEADLSDSDARETIIHEIYHCMLESVGFHENNFDASKMLLTNEQLVIALSKQTMTLKKLNPVIFSLLYHV